MELGSQIKKYRNKLSLSQDALAEKVYVSRQTISNWENGKSYPDVNSLVLLSEIFQTSIDNLIKGDVEIMKEQVRSEERNEFKKLNAGYAVLFLAAMVSPIPLAYYLKVMGMAIWAALVAVTLLVAFAVEKKEKQFDIQTYKEIIAFSEGQKLDEIEKNREKEKRPCQKTLIIMASGVVTLIIAVMFGLLLKG